MPHDWSFDANVNFNRIQDNDTFSNLPLQTPYNGQNGIAYLINNGLYNPLAPAGLQGDIRSANYTVRNSSYSLLADVDVKATTNSLFTVPGGDVGFAVGASGGFAQYKEISDQAIVDQDVMSFGGSSGAGQRNYQSAYAEFDGPLFVKKLELQLAGRFDKYSDFGNTFNPKIGLLYHASKDLLFRGSWGTGFQAPLLQELYGGTSVGYDSYFDSKTNNYYDPQHACPA